MTEKKNAKKPKDKENSISALSNKAIKSKKNRKLRLSSLLKINVLKPLSLILPSLTNTSSASENESDNENHTADTKDNNLHDASDDVKHPIINPDKPLEQYYSSNSQQQNIETRADQEQQNQGIGHSPHYVAVDPHPKSQLIPSVPTTTVVNTPSISSPSTTPHIAPKTTINDAATVSSATVAVDETDTVISTSGTLTSTDIDNPDNTFTPDSISGAHGDLTIDANGHWTFTANSAFNQLNVGDKVEESFTVSSVDGTTSTIKVTINGTNDAATVSTATVAVDETNTAISTSGTLTSTDVDNPDNTFTPDSISGTHGDLTIDANGHWTFTANSAFNQLNVGDKAEETFTVTSIDGTPSTIKVTINGTNDAATVSTATVAVDETDTAISTSGTLTSTDVDNPDNTFIPDSITGTNGDLTIDANGHWTFTANSAFNQLNVGDKVEETFTVTSVDGTPSTIKVTINGTNDAATVSTDTVTVDETDTAISTSGTLTSTDIDNPDNTFTPDAITGTNGNLTIDANGHWTFTANNAFNQLNVGDKVEETFTVTSIDGTPSTIKVTINGTNDAATVSTATVAVDETDTAISTSGTLTSTDVDNPDNMFTPNAITGTNGNLNIDANGHWTFTANNAFNQLNVGDKVEETFTVSSVDGTPSTIKVTINGTNDAATVSSATVAVDETNTAISTSGTLTSTDVDNPDNTFTPDSISGAHGDLTIDANGHWTFTANSAFNQLNVGEKVEETFTVTSVDGTPSTIKVTINGTNDAATVSSETVSVDETDKAVTTSGTLTSTDVDNPDNAFTPGSIIGTNGDLTIDAHGDWTFTANSAFNQLNVGDKVEETFTVASVDGTPSTIKVTINGTNDKATVSTATVSVDETDKAVSTSGTLTSTDVDNSNNMFTAASLTGAHGNLTIDANGYWTFTANSAFNQLNVGDKVEETFTVASIDGTPSTIKVTINGTNDAATVSSATAIIDETDKAVTTSGTLTSTDVDNIDNAFTPSTISGTNGDFTIDASGQWTFTADSAFNSLNVGDKVTETFNVISVDGTPSAVTVTINGTNDSATVSSASVAVDETDSAITASGTLTNTDVDNTDNAFTPSTVTGSNGDFTIDASGQWTFTANSAFNNLNVGDKITETFNVTSVDGTPSTVTVTINGTNDIPTISGADTGTLKEDVSANPQSHELTVTGKLDIVDIDTGESSFVGHGFNKTALQGHYGHYGHIQISPDGSWSYFADNSQTAIQTLGKDEHLTDTIQVTSKDGTTHDIVITINGTNDAPVITPVATQTVSEDGSKTITFHATDVDTTDTLTPSVSATHGTAVLNTQGQIVFTPDANYNGPATVVLSVTDGHTTTSQTINVDVTPANDAPVITPIPPISATEDGSVVTGKIASTDIDTGDTVSFKTTFTQGGFTLNTDGSYKLDPTDASFQHLKAGEIDTLTIPVTVTDSGGATDTKDLVITITGTNDAPTISGIDTGTLKEDVGVNPQSHELTATGKLDIVDIDTGESSFVGHGFNKTALQGHYGHIQISPDGSWSYFADNSQTAIQTLGKNEHLTDTLQVTSKDGTTHDIVITINGTNDGPTVSHTVSLPSGNEDQSINITVQQLLANATDIDSNDLGQLSVDNLQVDHGSISQNTDGSFTFTPTPNYNGPVHFNYDVKDAHGGVTHTGANMTLSSQQDAATFSGADTGDVHEGHTYTAPDGHMTGGSVDDRSPDHMHGNIGKLWNDEIHTEGQLIITDADKGEGHVATGTYQGQYGRIIMLPNGEWNYFVSIGQDSTGRKIDHLGENQTLTDTVTVKSADGTRHDITITIHGDNDNPYCSSEVTLVNGEEDKAIILTSAQLLQNTVDVDENDVGKLSIDNLQANHGAITINPDGSFTFTPEKDYNGDVHFDYDVKDVHGGVTHTGANVALNAIADSAIITGQDTGAVDEGHGHYFDMSPDYGKSQLTSEALYADGKLDITDPDLGESKFDDHGGGYSYSGQYGRINLHKNGTWHYMVDIGHNGFTSGTATTNVGTTIDKLGDGDSLTDTITVYSKDGTAHDIVVTIHGDNDAPYCSSEVQLNSGKEDIAQTLTLNQLLKNTVDVDTNDAGQLAIGNLQVDHGSIAINTDGTFTFTPAKDYNGPVHFNYDVKDAHGGVTHTGASLDLAAVDDAAIITGQSTGDVDEGYGTFGDRSPDYAQAGMAKIGQGALTADGKLDIVDPDTGESQFDPKGGAWNNSYHGQYGHLLLNTDGTWHYDVPVGSVDWVNNRKTTVGTTIDKLGEGQTLTDTITIQSKDGTTHDIVITIHGDNDKPYCSSEVQLNSGKEDTAQVLTLNQLLQNTVDVDANDAGQLTIANLHAYHGSILDNKDGTFTFTPAKDYNGDVHFNYDVKDAHGGVTHTGANMTLTSQQDAATFSGVDTGNITEDKHVGHSSAQTIAISGSLTVTDPDAGQDHFQFTQFGEQAIHDPFNGSLHITPQGNWGYSVKNSALQYLHEGDVENVVYRVYSADGTSHDITITVTGTNDAPVLAAQTQSVIEDDSALQGQMQATDVDYNSHPILSYEIANPVDGLTFNADGSYTFDPTHASYQHLGAGQEQTITIPVTVKDEVNATSTQNLTITVHGTNDAAIISGGDIGTLKEDASVDAQQYLNAQGQLTVVDTDTGESEFESHGWNQTAVHGLYGNLTIDKTGDWTYFTKNSNPTIQSLGEGEQLTDTLQVTSKDGTTHDIVITINGTNDAPVITPVATQTVSEDGSKTITFHATDVDTTDTLTPSVSATHGTAALNAQGEIVFTPDANYNGPATVVLSVTDGHTTTSQTINVDVTPTNDTPVITPIPPISATEDGSVVTGKIASTDIDTGDTVSFKTTFTQGGFTLNTDGSYKLDPTDASFQHLKAGEIDTLTIPVTVTDSGGATDTKDLVITITGTNDAPTISGIDTGTLKEDVGVNPQSHELTATGKLDIVDIDTGESSFVGHGFNKTALQGHYGHIQISPDGSWSYFADNSQTAIQTLGKNEHLTDTLQVTSKDGTTHDIVITINGTNDGPTVSHTVSLPSGNEDQSINISVQQLLANATDIDSNDLGQLSVDNLQVDHGSISQNTDGSFTFTPTPNYNGPVHLNYDVKDAHGGVTHTGAITTLAAVNDNPDVQPLTDSVIEGATSPHHLDLLAGATDKEGDALNIEQLSFSVDGGKSSQLLPSGLSIAKDGHTLLVDATNPAFNYLNAGQPLNITASYLVSDGHGGQTQQTAVLTIEGTDDKAVLVSNVIQMSETEALQSEFTRYQGKLQLIDPDTGDNTQFQFGGVYIGQGFPPGELDIWPDGSYSFHLETALNRHADDLVSSLHQGESMEFPYTVKTTDGQTVTIMVKVIGEDSQARIEVGRYSSVDNHVTEDHFTPGSTHNLISSSGHLHVVDPDHDQAGFIAQDINTPEGGHFHINARGSWAYSIDNSKLQHLGAGESYQKTFTVESIDGSTHRDITVTVHGTNDNPVISSAISLPAGVEDTKIILTSPQLLANTTDIDDNDAGQLSIANLQTDHGSILANTNGTFTFTPEANYNGQVKFTYDVKDAHGGISHTSASTTLAAVNDAGVITGDKSGTVTEDRHVQGDAQHTIYTVGVLNVIDPDAGENHFHENHNVHALHDPLGGSFTIGKAGDWSYSVPNSNVQHLAKDQVETVQYEVLTQGGDKQIVTVSIKGTNDDPILSVTQTTPTTGTLTETDIDAKDTHSFSVVSPSGQFGDLSVDPTSGTYVYTPNASVSGMSYNSATHTYHGADVFEVKVADNHGGESSRFVTFDTNGQVTSTNGQPPSISTTVPQNPIVTTAQPTLPAGTNTPPSNTVTVDLATSSDSGTSDTDNLTNNNTPTITGQTDIPYSQVTIYDGSTPIGHAVSDASGQYSALVSNLTDGDHNLSAKALAPSSSLPATSSLLSVHVDTAIAPLTIALTNDTGSNAADLITSDGALTISGQETGAIIEYSSDNGQTWTSSFTPQPGSNTVGVRQTDTAGNISATTSLTFTLDDQIAAPSVDLTSATDSGASNTDDLTNVHTPVITGSAEANSAISITDETGKVIGTGTTNSNGVYQITTSDMVEGNHTLTVTSTDTAGNQSQSSLPIEVDYTAPVIHNVNLSNVATHQPTFQGTVSLDTTQVDIVIQQGGQTIETLHATLDGKGGYSVDATNIPDGDYTAYIQATDEAGNTTPSMLNGKFDRFSVDTHAQAPSITFESTGADSIYNAAEVASGAANTVTASIHLPSDAEAGHTLIVNGVSHIITDSEESAGKVNVEVLPGSTLSASIIDSEGNQSTLISQIAPVADLSAAPLTLSLTHDTGSSAADLITNDGALTISGQEAGAIVEYSTDNGTHWSQSFTAAQGANTVTVRQTDSAGNVSPSSSLSFTLDNQVTAPIVSLRSDTSGELHPTTDFVTQDARLSIQTEAGAQIEYSNNGGQSWSSMFNPVEGVNNLLVRQTDIAGNQSATTHFSFTLDTTPGTVSVNPISTDNALNAVENNQALVITGTTSNIAAGDRVYLNFGNNHFREASVHTDGTWSLAVSASDHQRYFSADGSYPIKIGSVDLAGNATPEISTHLIVDTQKPIPHISVDSVTRDNIINLAESGQNIDITGHVSGDFNVGDAVSLSVNGATISALTGVVDSQGNYSISVPAQTLIKANIHSIYASGQQPVHSIEATVITTDQAGNIGSATTGTQAFSIDNIASANIQLDPVTADNVINAAESNHNVSITGHVSGDVQQGDTVNILVGQQTHTGIVDQNGQFSIDVAGSELTAQTAITATVDTTDNAGNPAHASQTLSYAVDTQVDMPTITFENPGSDNAYSKAEIAQGHAGTITATVHAAADAKIGEHININGVDHVLDTHSLRNGLQIEVAPGSHVQVTMTDEHGNTTGSQGFAASAIPDPIIVKAPPGSHQVSGSLGTPPLLPSLTPVPTAQHGWRIHLPDGSYVTSHHGQYGTLTIDPQTGDLHYQEQANVHTGPHGSASGIGQHEDKFEVALQGTNQDEVVAHVNVQILSHGPGNSGKLNIGTEVVDMTITPITHTSHPAPPPPPPVLHDDPDMSSQADFTVTQSDDSYLDLTQHAHQAPDQKTNHHGAAAYLDALGIKPDTTSTVDHGQPADMDIVLAQVDQQDAATHDQAHLDMSDALEHHDANANHNQDDEHHHHNGVDELPDIDPNP
ncbi:VCBS domain-containing protein [Vibrio sp. FNV 38]|nr:VCBS domain-containing protein [Vibrio sp. FNV 38]